MILVFSIIAGILGVILLVNEYKKDNYESERHAKAKKIPWLLLLPILIILVKDIAIPSVKYAREDGEQSVTKADIEELVTKKDFERFLVMAQPPSIEEVEDEIKREVEIASDNMKEEALYEYQSGLNASNQGQWENAIKHYNNAMNKVETPSFYFLLGKNYIMLNNHEKANENYFKALRLYQNINNNKGIAITSYEIGFTFLSKGALNEAQPYLEKSLDIFLESKDKIGEAYASLALWQLYLEKKDGRAVEYKEHSKRVFRHIGADEEFFKIFD